jgi:hypothetical protein
MANIKPRHLEWFLNLREEELEKMTEVQPKHLKWFLGLTKEELDKLVRKTNNGPHGGGQEIF